MMKMISFTNHCTIGKISGTHKRFNLLKDSFRENDPFIETTIFPFPLHGAGMRGVPTVGFPFMLPYIQTSSCKLRNRSPWESIMRVGSTFMNVTFIVTTFLLYSPSTYILNARIMSTASIYDTLTTDICAKNSGKKLLAKYIVANYQIPFVKKSRFVASAR